ncbi:hypothetical protein DQ04_03331000 [Trypanosoma grayi]|uniref:hypothetical protein n=1 Tax=Trypanosoma grayi TaxID=71804 RepID=UPI0004F44CE2|nr:hypothetical protein DQ04_03331000 [Trypanosoma grayi]KEG10756.1 hypothetical protein DQ04_03331000 [Trypanosoma grayi]
MGHWVFDRVADGLFLQGLRPHLSKLHRQDVLLDVNGSLLTGGNAADATTWRSHHAFSGRCGLRLEQAAVPPTGPPAAIVSTSASDYRAWVADFHLQSTSEEPHLLVSVAPHYAPLQGNTEQGRRAWRPPTAEEQDTYDKRMLETPLIWEEPMTISIDCTASGMFLWSEELGYYGEKVAERCFVRRSNENGGDDKATASVGREGHFEAFLRLSWRMAQTGDTDVASTRNSGNSNAEMAVFVRADTTEEGGNEAPCDVPAADTAKTGGSEAAAARRSGGNGLGDGAYVWRLLWERAVTWHNVPDEVHFTPYVTLMDGGDEVTLL